MTIRTSLNPVFHRTTGQERATAFRFPEPDRHGDYEMNHNESAGLRYDRGEVRRAVTEVVKTITTESLTTTREGRR